MRDESKSIGQPTVVSTGATLRYCKLKTQNRLLVFPSSFSLTLPYGRAFATNRSNFALAIRHVSRNRNTDIVREPRTSIPILLNTSPGS